MTPTMSRESDAGRGARVGEHDLATTAQARGDRLILSLVGLGVFVAYLAIQRGVLFGWDGSVMASVARNLWTHRSLKECCNAFGGFPKDPGPWSPFGIGYSLVLAPLWHFQLQRDPHGAVWLGLANPFLLAMATVVIAKTGLVLGWRRSSAVLAALAFALLTMAPEYSTEFFSEPGMTLAMSVLLLGVALWPRRMSLGATLIGLGGMIAVLFRPDSVFLVLPAAGAVFATKQWRAVLGAWREWILRIGIPIGLSLVWTMYYDWLRYGKLVTSGYTGYYGKRGFSNPLIDGIGLELWSPGKSFFLYAPILIAAVPGFIWLARNSSRVVVAVVLLCVLRIVFYARWWTPTGGAFTWGPRFLMPLCGVLALPLGATIERIHELRSGARRCAIGALGMLAALSAVVQFSSIALGREDVAGAIGRSVTGIPITRRHLVMAQRVHSYEWTFGGNHVVFNLRHIGSTRWSTMHWFHNGPSGFGVAMLVLAALACTAAIRAANMSDASRTRYTERSVARAPRE
jgi:hypothetical protein